mgnify:CR=1 FL=1
MYVDVSCVFSCMFKYMYIIYIYVDISILLAGFTYQFFLINTTHHKSCGSGEILFIFYQFRLLISNINKYIWTMLKKKNRCKMLSNQHENIFSSKSFYFEFKNCYVRSCITIFIKLTQMKSGDISKKQTCDQVRITVNSRSENYGLNYLLHGDELIGDFPISFSLFSSVVCLEFILIAMDTFICGYLL